MALAIPVVKPGQKLPAFAELEKLYAYDTAEPFNASLGDFPTEELGATFAPISYNVNGGQAAGYLVLPEGEGPFPVVVYAPGHGDEFGVSRWNRTAARLAEKGYAGLLLEESGGPFWKLDGQGDVQAFVEYVVQERRGLDLLETMPDPDLQRQFVVAAGPRARVFLHSRGHGIWPDGRRVLEAWIVKNL